MSDRPLVSIGMPVYNGEAYVVAALETLTSQDYPSIEILVSDNASTDRTEEVCRQMVAADPRIRYSRNAENLGPMANFQRVVQLSRGKYFMWAAHDDLWSAHFVSALVEALEARPDAVLATSKTVYVRADGSAARLDDDRPAPGDSRLDNLRVFLADDATSWIYGLYRGDWLRGHAHEWLSGEYPIWGGDAMWIASVLLRYPVVGSPEATITKRVRPSCYAPKTESDKIRFALEMLRQLTAISRRYSEDRRMRVAATLLAWRYMYRQHFRRSTPLKTLRRWIRLPGTLLRLVV